MKTYETISMNLLVASDVVTTSLVNNPTGTGDFFDCKDLFTI